MVEVGRWLWERGLVAGTSGNLSARIGADRILATPAGRAKGRLEPSDLVVVDPSGARVAGHLEPSSELKVHLAAYRQRSDVDAVVHAHPRTVVAMSLAGQRLAPALNPEKLAAIGPLADVGYEPPGSAALAARLERALGDHNALVMQHHGALTLGRDLEQAFNRLEMLEGSAQIYVTAKLLGGWSI
jgi:L-fuculose-phosphate aldolase